MTSADAADFMQRRYQLKSALADGVLTCDDPQLFDASGAKVTAIDRSQEGDWLIEMLVADSAGNTTTIQLTYLVRKGDVSGSVAPTDPSGGNAGNGDGGGNGDGAASASLSNGRPSQWGTQLRALPQTGGPFGACPLHILFVLIMVLASAYTLMRLRQESAQRDERRRLDAEWEEFSREAVR